MTIFPLGIESAWLAPAIGILAFALIVVFGRYLPFEGSWISIISVGLTFGLFLVILGDFLANGSKVVSITWFQAGGTKLNLGMNVDSLSLLTIGIVTSVALAVQIYSLGYMKGEPRFGWYFAVHSLFAASMLGLILADNLLLLYITWELVGFCSYLLIGFCYIVLHA